ncbi:hypothetical protein CASFOL_018705 [Castilleja foliolosa]|uniref:Dirigent protein n=1 Tax=Castilleja foliolosa TaxID=1961234 RepID=A0ABD3D765_9LAMI
MFTMFLSIFFFVHWHTLKSKVESATAQDQQIRLRHVSYLAPTTIPPPNTQLSSPLSSSLHLTTLLILGLIVLRARTPTLRLSTAAFDGLSYGPPSLNMTIVAGIHLRNTNFGRFMFGDSNAVLLLGNDTIGGGIIYGGGVGSRERREMNVSVRVIYHYMNFSGADVNNLIGLRSLAELSGEVRVLKMMSRRRSALMNCTLGLAPVFRVFKGRAKM